MCEPLINEKYETEDYKKVFKNKIKIILYCREKILLSERHRKIMCFNS